MLGKRNNSKFQKKLFPEIFPLFPTRENLFPTQVSAVVTQPNADSKNCPPQAEKNLDININYIKWAVHCGIELLLERRMQRSADAGTRRSDTDRDGGRGGRIRIETARSQRLSPQGVELTIVIY